MAQSHIPNDKQLGEETSRIKVAFFLNLLFAIIELIGGLLTNSVAILSDALHDLGDSLSLGMSWFFQKVSKKKRDNRFSYGYRRFSILGALLNSLVLIVGSVIILYEAVPRLFNPEMPNAKGMLLLAILGIMINGLAVLKLGKGKSLNEKAVRLHLFEDVLGWLAVLIGSIILLFFEWPIIDPILSVLIAFYILFNVFRNLKDVLSIFLQAQPGGIDLEKVEDLISSFSEVKDIHDLHLWSMDGEYHVLSVHIVINKTCTSEQLIPVKNNIKSLLKEFDIDHVTIEFETELESCHFEDC